MTKEQATAEMKYQLDKYILQVLLRCMGMEAWCGGLGMGVRWSKNNIKPYGRNK